MQTSWRWVLVVVASTMLANCQSCLKFQPKADAGFGGGTVTGQGGGPTGGFGGGDVGGGLGGGGQDAGPLSGDNYCRRKAEAQCRYRIRCGSMDEAQLSDCINQSADFCAFSPGTPGKTRSGALLFDVDAGSRCVSSLQTLSCAWASGPWYYMERAAPGCDQALSPNARLGERCGFDDCAEGQCPIQSGPTCSVCVPFFRLGDVCQDNRECGPQAYCESLVTDGGKPRCVARRQDGVICNEYLRIVFDSRCLTNRCAHRLNDGGYLCGLSPLGQLCDSNLDCASTAFCSGLEYSFPNGSRTLKKEGTCRARVALGQACSDFQVDDGCADGGTCLSGTCQLVTPGTRKRGESCDRGEVQCAASDYCADIGGSTLLSTVDEVVEYYYFPDGGPSLRQGTCLARGGTDAPCQNNRQCLVTHSCRQGKCNPLKSSGETCSSTAECKYQLSCGGAGASSQCQPRLALGQPCYDPFAIGVCMLPATCITPMGANQGTCAARLPVDSPCESAFDCESQRCTGVDRNVCFPPCFP